jgi:hypothetical protein
MFIEDAMKEAESRYASWACCTEDHKTLLYLVEPETCGLFLPDKLRVGGKVGLEESTHQYRWKNRKECSLSVQSAPAFPVCTRKGIS